MKRNVVPKKFRKFLTVKQWKALPAKEKKILRELNSL